ncbi:hypothetical protein [Janthinobacterium sp. PSPC3-1]|uniref:hypothetical protein n=1 Tax=Janthinobacterium sp. PSPC3-1 TaxID=2804653 RepID=UPI003CEE5B4C
MNITTQQALPVAGSWTHSFEEDEAGVLVYRPTHGYPFPPARRGRETLEFGEDGQLTTLMAGPDDRPLARPVAQLKAMGGNRYALMDEVVKVPQRVIEVIEATPEVLKLARQ